MAGCAGGSFENICDATDILDNKYIGSDEFSLSIYRLVSNIHGTC